MLRTNYGARISNGKLNIVSSVSGTNVLIPKELMLFMESALNAKC